MRNTLHEVHVNVRLHAMQCSIHVSGSTWCAGPFGYNLGEVRAWLEAKFIDPTPPSATAANRQNGCGIAHHIKGC